MKLEPTLHGQLRLASPIDCAQRTIANRLETTGQSTAAAAAAAGLNAPQRATYLGQAAPSGFGNFFSSLILIKISPFHRAQRLLVRGRRALGRPAGLATHGRQRAPDQAGEGAPNGGQVSAAAPRSRVLGRSGSILLLLLLLLVLDRTFDHFRSITLVADSAPAKLRESLALRWADHLPVGDRLRPGQAMDSRRRKARLVFRLASWGRARLLELAQPTRCWQHLTDVRPISALASTSRPTITPGCYLLLAASGCKPSRRVLSFSPVCSSLVGACAPSSLGLFLPFSLSRTIALSLSLPLCVSLSLWAPSSL